MCDSLLDRGYLLRVDLPPRSSVEAPDTLLERTEDMENLLSRLSGARRSGYLYPVKIWGLERGNTKQAMKAIESLSVIRFDTVLAEHIIELGCVRFELEPSYMVLWFSCAKMREMRTVIDAIAGQQQVTLDWKVGSET